MPGQRPTTLRLRRLAAELRQLRDGARLSREDVCRATLINEATLYRIETAQTRPQRRTLTALLNIYQVAASDREELLELARRADEQSWLQSFPADLPGPYLTYIGFEGQAESIANYEGLIIPGLLQTEDYARAALQAGLPAATAEEIDRLVQVRMARQAVLTRTPPVQLWAIVDEAALHRPVGGERVMSAQLDRLAKAAELPHITLQVIPYHVGGHPGMGGSFAVLRFGQPSEVDVVYVESQAAALFLESPTDIRRFTRIFEHLRALSLPPADSVSLMAIAARTMSA